MAGGKHMFLKNRSELFFRWGWTVESALNRRANFVFLAHAFFARDTGRMKRAGERFCLTGE
jgi:hypothetical protein